MRTLALAILLLLPAGCGYQATASDDGYHWGSIYRSDIQTVAVPIFTTRDLHRGVEFQLTEAIVKKIEQFTPYKVISRDQADTILEGEIVAIRTNEVTLDPSTATPQQQQYSLTINFTWKNLHTGEILVSRHNFEQTSDYYPTLGESQNVGSQDSVEKLALAIVHQMQASW